MEDTKAVVLAVESPSQAASVFMPIMSMEIALQRRKAIVEFTKQIMVQDQDYGVIPGTNKPSLLKPGAEKLCSFFGLEPEFIPLVEDADWTGDAHKGEAFYYIRYRCRLLRGGVVLGVGEGSCNSWESKYRWRQANRKCPTCGQESIIAGKAEYGGGWLCFKKKGGCGAKFAQQDPVITGQEVGRVANPDVADVVNTIQKMAQKRALVAATLIATSASEFFTQDVEDNIPTGTFPMHDEEPVAAPQKPAAQQTVTVAATPQYPPALQRILDGLDKPGAVRQALDLLANNLMFCMPVNGRDEAKRIAEKHGVMKGAEITLDKVRAACIEMYNVAEAALALKAKQEQEKQEFKAEDTDLPDNLQPSEEVAK